jgi:hypothetical protein
MVKKLSILGINGSASQKSSNLFILNSHEPVPEVSCFLNRIDYKIDNKKKQT